MSNPGINNDNDAKHDSEDYMGGLRNRAGAILRLSRQKLVRFYQQTVVFLGIRQKEKDLSEPQNVRNYLAEISKKIEDLPQDYKRLFGRKFLQGPEDFIRFETLNNDFQQTYDSFRQHKAASVAIVGEKGSGKSSFLRLQKSKNFRNDDVLHIQLQQSIWKEASLIEKFQQQFPNSSFSNVDELIAFLKGDSAPGVIVVEEIQNMYLRSIDGYEAIESLAYVLAETMEAVFWVVSCSLYAWNFMDVAFDINHYFSQVLVTDQLEKDHIEEIIMNHHQQSGLELVFISSEKHTKDRAYKNIADDEQKVQDHLRGRYFSDLADISEGNATVAMILWFRSIKKIEDGKMVIMPLENKSLKKMNELEPQALFVLSTVVRHEYLRAEELALTQRLSIYESRRILKRLQRRGFFRQTRYGFKLKPIIYREVINTLKDQNILHV